MNFFVKKASGMTLIELLVGAGIFIMVVSIAASSGIMIFKSKAKIEYTNTLYSETRFLMERMINTVRMNTIDYGEYFSQNIAAGEYANNGGLTGIEGEYGKNPGLYEMFFNFIPDSTDSKNSVSSPDFSWKSDDRDTDVHTGIFNTGADDNTSNDDTEFTLKKSQYKYTIGEANPTMGLFLISGDGNTKTLYRYKTEDFGGDNERGVIETAKMKLVNTKNDPTADPKYEWTDYYTSYTAGTNTTQPTFTSITPATINVTELEFVLSPLDDPKKSFAKAVDNNGVTVQIQPHVILKLTVQLSEKKAQAILGSNNSFTLQSSAASRIFNNVTFPRQ